MPQKNNKIAEWRGSITKSIEEINRDIKQLNKKLDKHIEWGQKNLERGYKFIAEHDKTVQRITDDLKYIEQALPSKGFCENVTNALFPKGDIPLDKKVSTMWYSYKIIKYGVVTSTTAIILAVAGYLFSLVG